MKTFSSIFDLEKFFLNVLKYENSSKFVTSLIWPTEQSEKNEIKGQKKSGISYVYVPF